MAQATAVATTNPTARRTETKRYRYEILRAQLELERGTFIPTWKELAEYILPRRPRFTLTDVNRGERRSSKIIDSTASDALDTLRSGMLSGIASPSRPWFRLSTDDATLSEIPAVKDWLETVRDRMTTIFLRSNLYNVLPIVYGDMGVFGTAAMMIEEDFDDVVRFYSFPVGSYMIANDERGKVNIFFREFRMTVRQLIDKFAEKDAQGNITNWKNFSGTVKSFWDNHELEKWIDVCHIIQPNPEFDPKKAHSKYKRFSSCYYERGSSSVGGGNYMESSKDDTYLRESGYDNFPVMAPRWETTGEDTYATNCPGLRALGDIKQLSLGERRIMQAIDKLLNPPMMGPPEMRNVRASILPGDINYVADPTGKGFRPVYQIDPRVQEMENKQEQCRQRIKRAFYEDKFLMLASLEDKDRTAYEVQERKEEKLVVLGPMLEQSNQDLHNPLIDLTFNFMLAQSVDPAGNFIPGAWIPEPPEELQGVKLKIEYVSIMAQAQKLVGTAGVERFIKFGMDVYAATENPEILDKIDFDKTLDVYGDLTSVQPGIVRSDEDVAKRRESRAQAQAEAAQAEQAAAIAQGARDLAAAKTDTPSALTAITGQAPAAAA